MSKVVKGITSIFSPKIPEVSTSKVPDLGNFAQTRAARKAVEKRDNRREGRSSTVRSTGDMYKGANLGGTA